MEVLTWQGVLIQPCMRWSVRCKPMVLQLNGFIWESSLLQGVLRVETV